MTDDRSRGRSYLRSLLREALYSLDHWYFVWVVVTTVVSYYNEVVVVSGVGRERRQLRTLTKKENWMKTRNRLKIVGKCTCIRHQTNHQKSCPSPSRYQLIPFSLIHNPRQRNSAPHPASFWRGLRTKKSKKPFHSDLILH